MIAGPSRGWGDTAGKTGIFTRIFKKLFFVPDFQNELRPDREFVEWLRLERLSGRLITRDLIKHKFRELLDYSQDALVPKGAAWFFKYADRYKYFLADFLNLQ